MVWAPGEPSQVVRRLHSQLEVASMASGQHPLASLGTHSEQELLGASRGVVEVEGQRLDLGTSDMPDIQTEMLAVRPNRLGRLAFLATELASGGWRSIHSSVGAIPHSPSLH